MRLAVLGDPLRFTLSPELHRAGLRALGLEGDSSAIRTPPGMLEATLGNLADAGVAGANLTHPLKEAAIPLLARLGNRAQAARSANTIGFEPGGWWGESTDGDGFVAALKARGIEPCGRRVVLLGAGGAARALACALLEERVAGVCVSARDPAGRRGAWQEVGRVNWVVWGEQAHRRALEEADLVVNATPLAHGLPRAASLSAGVHVVDLVYGPEPTPWVQALTAAGLSAEDGRAMLAHQARRSLALWTRREVPIEPLLAAVGLG